MVQFKLQGIGIAHILGASTRDYLKIKEFGNEQQQQQQQQIWMYLEYFGII